VLATTIAHAAQNTIATLIRVESCNVGILLSLNMRA